MIPVPRTGRFSISQGNAESGQEPVPASSSKAKCRCQCMSNILILLRTLRFLIGTYGNQITVVRAGELGSGSIPACDLGQSRAKEVFHNSQYF